MTSSSNINNTSTTKCSDNILRILISGAAGQIGYSLLPLFCTGQVFGPNTKMILHLLEIPQVLSALHGIKMELDDGAYPLVHQIICTADPEIAFANIDYAILVGGFPRKAGMQRKDLLAKNSSIFIAMGEGLQKYAKESCKILVVANPANTNCLICAVNAPKIPKKNFSAMSRLDFNRARNQIAQKLHEPVSNVKNVCVWGNHSATQVPDVSYVTIERPDGYSAKYDASVLTNDYICNEFRPLVQKRGKAIIVARGFSSAMSAANAAKDCVRDWYFGTNEMVAMAVYSDGSYGITKGIFYSFPVLCKNGDYEIVQGLKISDEIRELMKISEEELLVERDTVGLGKSSL